MIFFSSFKLWLAVNASIPISSLRWIISHVSNAIYSSWEYNCSPTLSTLDTWFILVLLLTCASLCFIACPPATFIVTSLVVVESVGLEFRDKSSTFLNNLLLSSAIWLIAIWSAEEILLWIRLRIFLMSRWREACSSTNISSNSPLVIADKPSLLLILDECKTRQVLVLHHLMPIPVASHHSSI